MREPSFVTSFVYTVETYNMLKFIIFLRLLEGSQVKKVDKNQLLMSYGPQNLTPVPLCRPALNPAKKYFFFG
jgi:hypothetical protein